MVRSAISVLSLLKSRSHNKGSLITFVSLPNKGPLQGYVSIRSPGSICKTVSISGLGSLQGLRLTLSCWVSRHRRFDLELRFSRALCLDHGAWFSHRGRLALSRWVSLNRWLAIYLCCCLFLLARSGSGALSKVQSRS